MPSLQISIARCQGTCQTSSCSLLNLLNGLLRWLQKHFGFKSIQWLRGAIKRKKLGFFEHCPKGGEGGLVESKISLTEKTEIFLDFFAERGGGV